MSLKLKFGNIAGVKLEQRMVNLLEKMITHNILDYFYEYFISAAFQPHDRCYLPKLNTVNIRFTPVRRRIPYRNKASVKRRKQRRQHIAGFKTYKRKQNMLNY